MASAMPWGNDPRISLTRYCSKRLFCVVLREFGLSQRITRPCHSSSMSPNGRRTEPENDSLSADGAGFGRKPCVLHKVIAVGAMVCHL
ncbi:hypothetical protein ACP70R_033580 [Stipagrostis hirtigluma subsp. patula]